MIYYYMAQFQFNYFMITSVTTITTKLHHYILTYYSHYYHYVICTSQLGDEGVDLISFKDVGGCYLRLKCQACCIGLSLHFCGARRA
jgi:hypothetical protein